MRILRCLLLSGGLLAALAVPVHAGSASLLLDIRRGDALAPEAEVRSPFLALGSSALVMIEERSSGRELWVTDGTEVGTRPLLDLCPGPCSSSFTPLATLRQVGIFTAGSSNGSTSVLWRSDGTRPGTFPLAPSPGVGLVPCPVQPATVGTALLFSARTTNEGTNDCGLWRTDGTIAGTVRLPTDNPGGLIAAGGQAFFVTFSGGWKLWRTDGTPGGAVQVGSWPSGSPQHFIAAGSRIFFNAPDDGRELWTSDGTAAGTRPLTRFAAAEPFVRRSDTRFDIVIQDMGDGSVCFLANATGTERELWCSDGTAAGTRAVTALAAASPFLGLPDWRAERFGNRLLFPANDGTSGNRWWTSDGQPSSMAPLTGCPGGCPVVDPDTPRVRIGGKLFFAARGEGPFDPDERPTTDLWVTDGTGPGTRRLRDFCPRCRVSRMTSLLGKLFFAAGPDSFSYDLWTSDGTPEGTGLLLRVEDREESILPFPPVALGGRALLAQGEWRTGGFRPWLWVSDGTPAGTERVSLLARNGESSQPSDLMPTPDGVRFLVFDDDFRLWSSRGTAATTAPIEMPIRPESPAAFGPLTLVKDFIDGRLWRTDGTAAGTFPLTPEGLPFGAPVVVGSRAVFVALEDDLSLWATDGTAAGTREIADLPDRSLFLLSAGSSTLLVFSNSPSDLLWVTDGTAAGTREIPLPADFRSFEGNDAVQLGSLFYFRGRSQLGGERLWRSDGTAAGTRPLAPGLLGRPGSFAVHAGALYVLAHVGPDFDEVGLFRSDGTDAGTVLLASVPNTTTAAPEFASFTSAGNLLFFVFDDGQRGRELWRTDGTPAGTFLVRDIVPGRATSSPQHLTGLNGRLYFTASSTGHGTELWESDGTEAGTRLLQDIAPGAFSSEPEELVVGGGKLFFTVDDGVHGREPWVYTPGGAGCAPSENALCLGGRFRVEADWRTGDEESGRGRTVALTADTGTFWFFDPSNVEVILKVLDGQGVNGHHWVFYGALSNVEYALTVTDTQTGAARRYVNPPGRLGSVGDTRAFGPLGASAAGVLTQGPAPEPEMGEARVTTRRIKATGTCAPSSTRLCLNGGRFAVEVRWKDFQGNTGRGQADALTGDTGTFWFFDESNVEVVLKVLDGRPLNGKFWVFYGALSSVEYALTITDTETGVVKTYTNPSGRLASVADTEAF